MDEVVLTPADLGAEQVAADVGTEEGIDVLGVETIPPDAQASAGLMNLLSSSKTPSSLRS